MVSTLEADGKWPKHGLILVYGALYDIPLFHCDPKAISISFMSTCMKTHAILTKTYTMVNF